MTFLSPMAGIIAAAATVPLVVMLYFLKLRRRPLRVSSTLLWERAVRDVQVNVPFRWLRMSWLLVLQLLGLACLVAATARPALDMNGPTGARVLILIDRSGSMNATDGAEGGKEGARASRLDEAKIKAREIARSALSSGGGRVMVAAFAARPTALCGWTASSATAMEAIEAAAPSDQPGDLKAALEVAATMAAGTGDEAANERATVFLISDGTLGEANAGGMDVRYVRVGPREGVEVDNVGIVQANARRDYEDPATVRVYVRVQNSGKSARSTRVELTLDGAVVGSAALEIPGSGLAPGGGEGMIAMARGEAAASFEIPTTAGGMLGVSLPGGDVLSADDAVWMRLSPVSKPRIVVVAPGRDGADADPFVIGALRALEPRNVEVVGEQSQGGEADLVVFDRVEARQPPRAASLSIGAGMAGVATVERPSGGEAGPTRVVSWQRNHPLLRHVGLETVMVDPPKRLTLVKGDEGRRSSVIAEGMSGPLIGVVEDGGVRRVFVGFDLARSTWGPHWSFPLFVSNVVDVLTVRGEAQAGKWFTTSGAVSVTAVGAGRVELTGPRGVAASAEAMAEQAGKPIGLGVVELAGLYQARGAVEGAVGVNMCDGVESLAWTSERVGLSGLGAGSSATAGSGTPREVWSWFVLAAVALLSVEWVMYAWQMRG